MDLIGAVVANRYSIERIIGRGGMATVWLARDVQHDRVVAIKTLHPELAGAIGIDRFLRELRITARLQHPSVVPVLDSGVIDRRDGTSTPWYAMPYLHLAHAYTALGDAGGALRALARHQPLHDAHFQLHLRCDPPFAPLHRTPRFRALVTTPPPVWGKGC